MAIFRKYLVIYLIKTSIIPTAYSAVMTGYKRETIKRVCHRKNDFQHASLHWGSACGNTS